MLNLSLITQSRGECIGRVYDKYSFDVALLVIRSTTEIIDKYCYRINHILYEKNGWFE